MTTPEHTLVGIHLAIAAGSHRWSGWPLVGLAALASNVPDLDGLPMLIDMQRFEQLHRVLFHNFLAIVLTSAMLACSEAYWGWINRLTRLLILKFATPESANGAPATVVGGQSPWILTLFFSTAFVAQTAHLPCDMVVSGGSGLSDWHVLPFWPFSDRGFVFALVPWGDIGPTLILMAGTIWMAKRRSGLSRIALITLSTLIVYLLVRGWMRGAIAF